jgi:uncharacterized protein
VAQSPRRQGQAGFHEPRLRWCGSTRDWQGFGSVYWFAMHPVIAQHLPAISAICERYNVRRLELFGSAARGSDFRAGSSDADFLIEFATKDSADLHSFFGIKAELEELLGLSVDLVETGAVRNPYVLADINRSRQSVYGS